jgi:hypothetical protein
MTLKILSLTRLNSKSSVVPGIMLEMHDTLKSICFFCVKTQHYQAKKSLWQWLIIDCVYSIYREFEQLVTVDIA